MPSNMSHGPNQNESREELMLDFEGLESSVVAAKKNQTQLKRLPQSKGKKT